MEKFQGFDEKYEAEQDARVDEILAEAFSLAMKEEDPERAINLLLNRTGEAFESSSVYIFEDNQDGTFSNTYTWRQNGQPPVQEDRKVLLVDSWLRAYDLDEEGILMIRNREEAGALDDAILQMMIRHDTHSFAGMQLIYNGQRIGLFGMNDPSFERIGKGRYRIGMLGAFLASLLQRRDEERRWSRSVELLRSTEDIVDRAFEIAMNEDKPDLSISLLLQYTGEHLNCDRTYIFEDNGDGTFSKTYEWCRPGVRSYKDQFQNISYKGIIEVWYSEFDKKHNVLLDDVESVRENTPMIYNRLLEKNVQTMAAGPLVVNRKRIGFFGVDNLPKEYLESFTSLFDAMGCFLAAMLRHRDNEVTVRIDPLTGVNNRNALQYRLKELDPDKSVVYIFCDINSLKRTNDIEGHEEGDRLISATAHIMSEYFHPDPVFRMGGDEFLVIRSGVTQEEAERLESGLRQIFQDKDMSIAVGAVWRETATEPFESMFREADKKMYSNKMEMHRTVVDRTMDYTIQIAERIPAACIVRSMEGDERILYMNRRALSLLECRTYEEADELSGGTFIGLIHPQDREAFERRAKRYQSTDINIAEREKDGEESDLQMESHQYRIRIITRSWKSKYIFGFVQYYNDPVLGNISYNLMYPFGEVSVISRDLLTDLPGMRLFVDNAERMMSSDEQKGIHEWDFVYINLVEFRHYNNVFGYEDGDQFLRKTAETLEDCFPGDFVARIAADRFAVFSRAGDLFRRIRSAHDQIESIQEDAGIRIQVGVFINTSRQMVSADRALEYAKAACESIREESGDYVAVYNETIAASREKEQYIIDNIDRAIEDGEIRVCYQPIVRVTTGNVCSLEALSRWDDPKYGMMNPSDFIGVLEEKRIIYKLDRFVIREICRQISEERKNGRTAAIISFNLSRQDIMSTDIDIFEEIENTLKEYGISRDMIRIEVTESTIIDEPEIMRKKLMRFHNAGYLIGMDDFGTGYSSLNLLEEYPFDILKLDRGFMMDLSEKNRKILTSIVKMAKSLGIFPIVEGVETEEQFEFLRQIGCDRAQGYLFGQPAAYRECVERCREQGREIERMDWRSYYDAIGMLDLMVGTPMYIIEYDGEKWSILKFNQEAEKLLRNVGYDTSSETLKRAPNTGNHEVYHEILSFLHRNEWHMGDKPRLLATPDTGHIIYNSLSLVAKKENTMALLDVLNDITDDETGRVGVLAQEDAAMAQALQASLLLYDNIYISYIDRDYTVTLYEDMYFSDPPGTKYPDILRCGEELCEKTVHPKDRSRFLEDLVLTMHGNNIRESEKHALMGHYRLLGKDGEYHWKLYTLMLLPNVEEKIVLTTIRDFTVQPQGETTSIMNFFFNLSEEDRRKAIASLESLRQEGRL